MITKMYGSATTTTASVATLEVPSDQTLLGIQIDLCSQMSAAGTQTWTISFSSSDQSNSNDTRGEIAVASVGCPASEARTIGVFIPLDEAIYAGERIYLHTRVNAGTVTSGICRALLISDAKESGRAIRRR